MKIYSSRKIIFPLGVVLGESEYHVIILVLTVEVLSQ
jgi:hypothetical protein